MLKTMVISTPGPRLTRSGKKSDRWVHRTPKRQYRIRAITFPRIQRYFQVQFAKLKTGLWKDQGYNLTTIKEERLRIDARLKEKDSTILHLIILKFR
jgi:hypothetical protein